MTVENDLPTYITLNKDINLIHLGKGRYDRDWSDGDFVPVEGIDSLHNGIRIKIMTIWGELINSPTYKQWGNEAWRYLKANNISINRMAIKEYFKQALNEMRRIESVDDIKVEQDTIDPNTLIVTYVVTSISDQLLQGGMLLSV